VQVAIDRDLQRIIEVWWSLSVADQQFTRDMVERFASR
jgi:hypothetical protein